MLALSKSACMDMTLMFMEDSDKKNLMDISKKLAATGYGKEHKAVLNEL
jgi:hypothetical protein